MVLEAGEPGEAVASRWPPLPVPEAFLAALRAAALATLAIAFTLPPPKIPCLRPPEPRRIRPSRRPHARAVRLEPSPFELFVGLG